MKDYEEEFLEMSYAAGAYLSGTQIEEQMRTMERNKKCLRYSYLEQEYLNC